MGFADKIYDKAPIFLQNQMCSLSGLLKNRERYGSAYREARSFCREFDGWSPERQAAWQREQLVRFVRDGTTHEATSGMSS